ncbi:MAG: ribosome recycling factor [Lentisphaerales bacterium]|jgi:ribosome recycling factor|nr:MAG: ribosome recycling factor [Lentisphaerales bacterium]
METLDDVLLNVEEKMSKCVDHVKSQFSGLRTGKASPALVENVNVDYYGTSTRLREIAGISTPEPRLIVINPYDPTALGAIEKAILAANLGITPMNDGKIIRLPIPELSEERRNEMTKVAKRMAEEGKVAIRNVRREANDEIKALEKTGKITEDDKESGTKEVQKLTDDYTASLDSILTEKEKEMAVV